MVAADRDDAEELRRLHALHRSLGLDSDWLMPSACRREEPGLSPRVAGGILAPADGHVDPRATVGALAAALELAGGELVSGVEVVGLETSAGRVSAVRTAGGRVATERAVIAAGCWSGEGLETGGPLPEVRPVKGQLLELRAPAGRPAPAERIVRSPRCYLLARGDGRVVLGATVEEQGFDTSVTADGVYRLLEAAWEVLPDVSELELVSARAGLRPGTPDNEPVIGAGEPEGLVLATGHYRNGVLLAPLTGRRRGGAGGRRRAARERGGLRSGGGGGVTAVILNGERTDLADRASVTAAVTAAGAPAEGRGVAVAVDGEVVPRGEWESTELHEGQRVEVLQAVQGG